ncbi:alpha/beta hydrolase [Nocardia sp. NPDC052001]|uniref:alpha/beta fold hydrolase n=1 Tax=Nocardia sp. NPDC052001 TaxID=3154853 RepID=UPI003444004B
MTLTQGQPSSMADMTGKPIATQQFTITHGDVSISASRGGHGRPLVLCPGLTSTQAELHELITLLRREFDVMTFDLRGHGLSSAADQYSFDAFLDDFGAVMNRMRSLGLSAPPMLVGHSYGADLIVHYASEFPSSASELVIIDGANPLPAPFITPADLPDLRTMWEDSTSSRQAGMSARGRVVLSAQEIVDLNLELDALRSGIDTRNNVIGPGILDRYHAIECPIHLIMATSMAGDDGDARTSRFNRLWRGGVDRLVRERPDIPVTWLDATHALVITHASEITRIIRAAQHPADQARP